MNLTVTIALRVRRWVDDELRVLRKKTSRQSNLSCTVSKEYSLWKSDLDKSRGNKVL